jgi:hypothetical protein
MNSRLKIDGNGFVIRNGNKTLGGSGLEKTLRVGENPKGLGSKLFLTREAAENYIQTELNSDANYKVVAAK